MPCLQKNFVVDNLQPVDVDGALGLRSRGSSPEGRRHGESLSIYYFLAVKPQEPYLKVDRIIRFSRLVTQA
jgi:hypothetical protein